MQVLEGKKGRREQVDEINASKKSKRYRNGVWKFNTL